MTVRILRNASYLRFELRSADFWSEASVLTYLTNRTNPTIYGNTWKERLLESTRPGVVT
jgi:hypothetical protein